MKTLFYVPCLLFTLGLSQCASAAETKSRAVNTANDIILESVYDGSLRGKWQDWGWAPRDTSPGKAERLNFANYSGWILKALQAPLGQFAALRFQLKAPAHHGDFLDVRLNNQSSSEELPSIRVNKSNTQLQADGTYMVRIPMQQLNPGNQSFDQIIFKAAQAVDPTWVEIDKIVFVGNSDDASSATAKNAIKTGYPAHTAALRIDCTKPTHPISPLIYGIAHSPRTNAKDTFQWTLGATARRWGGNHTSRYNWRLGNAWNTAADWYFTNVNYTNVEHYSWEMFLDENKAHHVQTALTLPMIGWVAKDTMSYAYPVNIYGAQRSVAPSNKNAGNGISPDGSKITGNDPRRTSIPATAAFVGQWVSAIKRYDKDKGSRSVNMYILDNEPSLWNSTHRDVHPNALTYDELLQRTIDYGSLVRKEDPDAIIAGPAEWGWPSYFYSAKDAEVGFSKKPDRLAHGDIPLLAWYLQKLRAYEQKNGIKILDVLDVHFYPQADGVYSSSAERNDPDTIAKRLRATRSLWDKTYRDESWINDNIELIPRLKKLIDNNYPGLKISIGEYNFGGEKHISGALALAEVLGRFGEQGIYSAFYWTYPPHGSCAYEAMRAYRNFDGQGAHFLDKSLVAYGDKKTSLFASQNDTGKQIVAIALNLDGTEAANASIEFIGCGVVKQSRVFEYTDHTDSLQALDSNSIQNNNGMIKKQLPPYSINVFEFDIDHDLHY